MDRINQYPFYELGQTFQKLRSSAGEVAPTDVFFELMEAQQAISGLIRGDRIPLGVSKEAARGFDASLSSIISESFYVKKDDGKAEFKWPQDDARIPEWRWSGLLAALSRFETVFSAEMAEATTYYIPQKGIYHTPALIDRADDGFPQELRGMVPQKTRDDWRAAGRCLALNLCTASGFHVARAVEGTLELYYQTFTNKPGVTHVGWHDYLKELEAIPDGSDPKPDDKTLATLRRMKDDYRNPVAHPRVVLGEADARVLFDMGESVIIGMAQGLLVAVQGTQPAFNLITDNTKTGDA